MSRFSSPRSCRIQTTILLSTLLGGALSGCGMTKNLDEMHASTAQMADTTTQMNDKMSQLTQMNQTMGAMNEHMDKMLTSMDHMGTGMDSMGVTMTHMSEMMSQMTEMNQSMRQMKDDMGLMTTTLNGMDKKMSVMPDMKVSLSHMDGVMNELNRKMISMDSKMDALPKMDKTMTGMSGQIGAMKGQLAALRGDLTTLKQMHTSLKVMEKGLTDMNTQVAGVTGKVDHMDKVATGAIVTALHGGAESLRRDELSKMEAEPTLSLKFPHAAAFFAAYDYQLVLKGTEEKVQADEDQLRKAAVEDYFLHLNGYNSGDKIDLAFSDNNMNNVMALAAASDFKDYNTIAHLKSMGRNPGEFPSLWDMIQQALNKRSQIENGSVKAQGWEEEVLANKKAAIYTAQLRANILAAVALQNLSDMPSVPQGVFDKIKQLGTVGFHELLSWNANVDKTDTPQLKKILETLTKAVDAVLFLASNGYPTMIDSHLHNALKNCKLPLGTYGSSPAREKALKDIADRIETFTKH